MSEEELFENISILDDKDIFEKLDKNKELRDWFLVELNASLQRSESIVTNLKDRRELRCYKNAVTSLQVENQKLKKQLEEYKRLGFEYLNDKCNKLENQQKEFIEYINSYIKLLSDDPDYIEKRQKDILEEILSKYKESGE